MASAIALYPAPFMCRWSPGSKSARILTGSFGSRTAASKSMTASYRVPVRIQSLSARRLASYSGEKLLAPPNGVNVAP
jgi:hypothetical protein